jgi:hypothetical protein
LHEVVGHKYLESPDAVDLALGTAAAAIFWISTTGGSSLMKPVTRRRATGKPF